MKGLKGIRLPGKGMSWKEFLKTLKDEYTKDNVGDVAGNLTFQGVLSLFPFLIFLVALGSLFLTPQNTQDIINSLGKVAPQAVTQILSERLLSLQQGSHAGLLTFGAVIAIWSASSGMAALMRALNTAYDVKEGRPFWKVRGVAILTTLLTAALSLIAALVAVATPALASFLGEPLGTVVTWLRLPVAGLIVMFNWAVLYYMLPDAEQEFRFITPGSVVGVVIWVIASWGFSIYVTHFGKYDATYGALGGVVVLLFWMWISAQVLLIGAEINAIIEHKSPDGKRAGAKSMADKGVSGSKSEEAEVVVGEGASPAMARQARGSTNGHPPGRAVPHHGANAKPLPTLKDRVWAAGAAVAYLLSRRRRAAH